MRRLGGILRQRFPIWAAAAMLVLGLAAGWFGGRSSVDQKLTETDVNAAYVKGEEAGHSSAELDDQDKAHKAHETGYWEGWQEGLEEGEEEGRKEGQRLGAELAVPEDLEFQDRYMVTYEPGPHGPVLRGYLKMPLNTEWECTDLDSCYELVP